MALGGVGLESEAEDVRFYEHRVTKVDPQVKHGPPGLHRHYVNKTIAFSWLGRTCIAIPKGRASSRNPH